MADARPDAAFLDAMAFAGSLSTALLAELDDEYSGGRALASIACPQLLDRRFATNRNSNARFTIANLATVCPKYLLPIDFLVLCYPIVSPCISRFDMS